MQKTSDIQYQKRKHHSRGRAVNKKCHKRARAMEQCMEQVLKITKNEKVETTLEKVQPFAIDVKGGGKARKIRKALL